MITGIVTPDREAVICLSVHGPHGRADEVDVAIDTGFNGFLTLPPALISRLELRFAGTTHVVLGDGSGTALSVYRAVAAWEGRDRPIDVLEADSAPVAGMSLLHGCELRIQVVENGRVTVEPLT